jgi:protease-4
MNQFILRNVYREGGSNTIAVIPIVGVIDDPQATFIRYCVEDVLADRSIQAVILRVDSPGGAVTPSDEIWNELGRIKDAGLPIVASYGSIAASGGYYVSCHADFIMAQETCITGSIGVIAQVMTFEGLLDKVGIEPVTLVASGSPEKNVANDIYRSWDDADRESVQIMIDSAYDIFLRRVKDGRSRVITDTARIAELADGSVYTAQQALDSGLIDGIGYLDDAIGQAETLAGIPAGSASVEVLFEQPGFLATLMSAQARQADMAASLDAEKIRSLVNDLSSVRIMYLQR